MEDQSRFPPLFEGSQEGTAKLCSRGTETILLVDDSAPLRRVIRRILEDCGYSVLDAGHPEEALRIAEKFPGPLPLMITDVVMPGFNGFVLAERMKARRPQTRILYASTYNEDSIAHLQESGQTYDILEKPFAKEDLLIKVRKLLDLPREPPDHTAP